MRRHPTKSEERLWREIRGRRFAGKKFRRQQPVGPYILDFFCPEAGLSIELDGGGHESEDSRAYDRMRSASLASAGIRELRFWNRDVDDNLEGVLKRIARELDARNFPPA